MSINYNNTYLFYRIFVNIMEKKLLITTSWDDGHALDMRIAKLLETYNLKGTFYVPLQNSEKPVMKLDLLKELSVNHEIGGHTVNHIYLDTLTDKMAYFEVKQCKPMLENIIDKKVEAFCFPGGKYAQRDIDNVLDAGFLFARTTKLFHTKIDKESSLMNTALQAYNHSSFTLNAHCVKRYNFSPIFNNLFFLKGNKNFVQLAEDMLDKLSETGGVFHLWGHSWEIDEYGLWSDLEIVFKMLSDLKNAAFVNNTACWKLTNSEDV